MLHHATTELLMHLRLATASAGLRWVLLMLQQ